MSETVATAGREVFVAFVRLAIRLGPLFVAAAAIGGLATQYLTEAGVEAVVGDHALGIALVALVGATVAVPPLFEIPLAAAALLVGMGRVTAGVLLFAVAIAGVDQGEMESLAIPGRGGQGPWNWYLARRSVGFALLVELQGERIGGARQQSVGRTRPGSARGVLGGR